MRLAGDLPHDWDGALADERDACQVSLRIGFPHSQALRIVIRHGASREYGAAHPDEARAENVRWTTPQAGC